jgi:UDP-3-O-[3-hydroxymyristoyl] glucosamine N-acyltransferase
VPGAVLGERCIIGANVGVEGGARAGDAVSLGDGSVVGQGCVLGSGCTVGRNVTIESGAMIATRVSIGSGAFIGEGLLIEGDVPAAAVALP